jgi:hypothetical protein
MSGLNEAPLSEKSLRFLARDPSRADVRSMAQELLAIRVAEAGSPKRVNLRVTCRDCNRPLVGGEELICDICQGAIDDSD